MTQQLESDLRSALRDRAAEVPADSIARLSRHDYHPRVGRLRPSLAIGGLATAAGAAGAAAIVISLGAGASNAFAGWTPTPTAPGPKQLAAASANCQTQSPIAGLPLKLTDTRGPFTFSVYANDNSSATCITGPSFTSVAGSMSSAPFNVPAGHVLMSSSHVTNQAGAYSFAEGRTGDGVSAVTLNLDDGSQVQATVSNGWFVAWWPSTQTVKSADITTAAGTSTQTFAPGRGPRPNGGNAFNANGGFASGGGAGQGAARTSASGWSLSQ